MNTRQKIRFIDLAKQQERIRNVLESRMRNVLGHGAYLSGPEVPELETRLAAMAGADHCVACASGTIGLQAALMAWNIGPEHAVFVPAFSFFATAEAVALVGATPVMVDIDPATFTIAPAALGRAVEAVRESDPALHPLPLPARQKRLVPGAIIVVDLFGQTADYEALLPMAERFGLPVLEDAAQSFGAAHGSKKACGLGCGMAATSFYPTKPLGCYGDGGAVFTDDAALAGILRSLVEHGRGETAAEHVRIGLNGRMSSLQAAILLAKLEAFADELEARRNVAAWYTEALADTPGITVPRPAAGRESSWSQYSVLVGGGRRDELARRLSEKGVPTAVYYRTPLHMEPAFRDLGYSAGDMPAATRCAESILALPMHAYLGRDEAGFIVEMIGKVLV